MAKGESRGGGYDRNTDRRNIGLLASATMPSMASGSTNAPVSIGQLMTPSAGRIAPTDGGNVDNANVDELAKRNESFLTDPTNMNMLKQFGMTLAGGGSPGHAMYQALTVPERAAAANAKAQEAGLDITQKQLNIQKTIKELTQGKEKTPTDLMKTLDEAAALEAEGRHAEASVLRSKAYKDSTIVLESSGQVIQPPGAGTGNAGLAPGTDGGPTIITPAGSKADMEAKQLAQTVAAEKLNTIQKGMLMNSNIDDITRILDTATIPPDYSITGFGSNLSYIAGTNASNVDSILNSIKARVSFQALQEMRDASKTGGALGQVSDYENRMLAATLSSLEQRQTVDQFRKNLATVKFLFDPNYIEQRAQISKNLADNKITNEEATNQLSQMYRQAVMPEIPGTAASPIDLATPPPYVSDAIKAIWNDMTPEEKASRLSAEDKAKMTGGQ